MKVRRIVGFLAFSAYLVTIISVATAVSPRTLIVTSDRIVLKSLFENLPTQPGFRLSGIGVALPPCVSAQASVKRRFTQSVSTSGAFSSISSGSRLPATRDCEYCYFLPQAYGCNEEGCNPTLCTYTGTPNDGCTAFYGGCHCARDQECTSCGI